MHNYRHKQEIAAPLKPRLPLPPAILLTKEATIYALSPSSQFADERESYYFHHYCNETATQITGPFSNSLWIRLVPQISETTPFIKHAILALGALSKSRIDIFQQHGVYDSRNVSLLNSHHQYALLQYSKTLKGIREASQDSSKDSITALIACLLVFCFECWQRHQAAATAHAATAVTLISQLRFKQNGHACVFSDACIPRYLDVDLYSAFSGLDLQALLFVDNRTTTMHQTLQDGMCSTIQGIPVKFSDLQQCRNYWQIIMRRNLHFVAAARAATFNTVTPKDDVQEISTLRVGNNIWSHVPGKPKGILTTLLEKRALCVEDIRRWEHASAPLFAETCKTDNSSIQDFLLSTVPKIHAAMSIVLLGLAFYPTELAADRFLPEFRTVVDLSYLIQHLLIPASTSPSMPIFRFDIGILPAISQVGLLCRDKEIRGKAIDLLLGNPGYREAIWESIVVGKICEFARTIEEVWCDGRGFVPGNRRATLTSVEFYGRWGRAEFAQRLGPSNGGVMMRVKCFTW
ncbi:hypothetical protein V501_01141 [Pseudogymnoascus sp. VKM F-4519 (FW-2642)]|nr:hypothetical protein V501_01141 [Pseudogymnoascus sp. VKM F-4519 (FW-2642)]